MSGTKPEYRPAARVLKSNGTEGEILVGFREIAPEDIDTKEPVFIEFDGLPVPFFIESFRKKGDDRALVHLTGVISLEDAEELTGKFLSLKAEDFPEYEDGEDGLSAEDLLGWTILDENGAKAGRIADYEDIPGNPCLYVDTKNGQAMIPLQEELILSVDEKSKTITLRIPEGLL